MPAVLRRLAFLVCLVLLGRGAWAASAAPVAAENGMVVSAQHLATRVGVEVLRAGGFPGGGGPVRLARLIGRGRTSLMVFSARQFSAREACDFGIVDLVVPAARLREETARWAEDIAANSPAAIRAAKVLIRRSLDLGVTDALKLSHEMREPFEDGPDFAEALQAWRDRRPPRFQDA